MVIQYNMKLRPSDIVITVMSVTGPGKSTFISKLVDDDVTVGHGLKSMTAMTGLYRYQHAAHGTIYLIDSPGFDDTFTSDADVLKNIAAFMSETYKQRILLAGVIYMHRITDNRLAGSSLRNIKMFKELCGNDAYKHVVFTMSMWGKEDYAVAVRREQELKGDAGFWGLMHARGSQVMRWTNDTASASAIVEHLVRGRQLHGAVTLQIQREMVDKRRDLHNTSAGQEVSRELSEAKRRWEADIAQFRRDYEDALAQRDKDLADQFRRQEQDTEEKLRRAPVADVALMVDMDQLLRETTQEYEKKLRGLRDEFPREMEHEARLEKELNRVIADREKDELHYEELRKEWLRDRQTMDESRAELARKMGGYEKSVKEKNEQGEEVREQIGKSRNWARYLLKLIAPLVGITLAVAL